MNIYCVSHLKKVYQVTVEIVISEQWLCNVSWFLKEHYCPAKSHTTLHDHVLLVTFYTVKLWLTIMVIRGKIFHSDFQALFFCVSYSKAIKKHKFCFAKSHRLFVTFFPHSFKLCSDAKTCNSFFVLTDKFSNLNLFQKQQKCSDFTL